MEQQQQQHRECNPSSKSGFLCRQSSTRWIPTGEQLRILRELYYIKGVRSPSAAEIQGISANLRQYGKIEGKNVFYWFQNHKARERQKKRLTGEITTTSSPSTSVNTAITSSSGVPTPCSSSSGYDASVLTERTLWEYCMPGGGGGGPGMESSSMDWVGLGKSPAMPWMCHYSSEAPREIETLPLFPINSQEEGQDDEQSDKINTHQHFPSFHWNSGQPEQHQLYGHHHHHHLNDGGATSLELTLNSYCYPPPPDSM